MSWPRRALLQHEIKIYKYVNIHSCKDSVPLGSDAARAAVQSGKGVVRGNTPEIPVVIIQTVPHNKVIVD